jgi:methionyl-tRNA formyltransferase
VPILSGTTAGELHDRLAELGAALMSRALVALEAGRLRCEPQSPEGVLYARKIDKAEARIDFSQSARAVRDQIHALSPYPGAWCTLPAGRRILVLLAVLAEGSGAPGSVLAAGVAFACGEGAIRLLVLQREGKAPMQAAEFLHGLPIPPTTSLA